ncbi:MAG: aminomethyl-transferring glycine dehydrogenase subunit GcvPB [Synergistaceae bacterium]
MKLVFELSHPGRSCSVLPKCDVPTVKLQSSLLREKAPRLPELSENDISRHYTRLANRAFGVNCGFYPLGSCTMKYNPRVNEEIAALSAFNGVHPLQPTHTVQGCMEVLRTTEKLLAEITGMDNVTFQPAAGAHGEYTGVLLIKAYHQNRKDEKRTKIVVPDSAHGTNPATAVMAGYTVINVPSNSEGGIDIEKLREAVDVAPEEIAGLMLTNPNTVGIFDKNILTITEIIHNAGGLCYYDGANLNAIMGNIRPGDMGFDVIHLNLHKTFSTPHGGGGPGSGAVGCKKFLAQFLPKPHVIDGANGGYDFNRDMPLSIGKVKDFYGNFLVVVRTLSYILTLGREGIPEASRIAVLNANYMMKQLSDVFEMAYDTICMHEFVITLEKMHKDINVSALDFAKGLLDNGIHPPTMYFPLIVHEALMIEPTETEGKDTLDEAVSVFKKVYDLSVATPENMHNMPLKAAIRRPDEVKAAREPNIRYTF